MGLTAAQALLLILTMFRELKYHLSAEGPVLCPLFADIFTYGVSMIHDFSVISNSSLSIETPEEANDQERLKEQSEIMTLFMLCI